MAVRKQPELQPFYGADDVLDGQVLDAVVVKSGGGEKVLVSRWHLGVPKRRFLVQAGIILLAVLCLGALRLMTSHGDASSTVRVEDTKALLAYRRDLARIGSALSDRSRIYRQQSEQAASKRDLIGLFDAANSYQMAVKGFAIRTDALALPRLENRRAQEFATAAQGELKASLTGLQSAILQMVEAVDRGEIRATAFTAMQSAMRFSDQAVSRQDVMLKQGLALLGGGARDVQQTGGLR
jgi:hypothetical protein